MQTKPLYSFILKRIQNCTHISSIWAPTLNVPFSHVYPELGGDRFYSQFRCKKQKNKVVSEDEFTSRHCSNSKCVRHALVSPARSIQDKRLCARSAEAQLQAWPSVLPPSTQNTHVATEQSCCNYTCVFITTAATGEFRWKTCLCVSPPSIKVFCCCEESAPLIYACQ